MIKKIIAVFVVFTAAVLPLAAQPVNGAYANIMGGDAEKKKETPKYSYLYDTSLIRSIKTKDVDRIKLLMYANIDTNEKNDEGYTPLYVAADTDLPLDYVRMMLQRNAKVNLTSKGKITPLMIAVAGGKTDLVKLLLEYGADPSIKDANGANSLIYAAKNKKATMVPLLAAARNLKVDEPDNTGITPFLYSYNYKDYPTMTALAKAGANINIKDELGTTPLLRSTDADDTEMIKALVNLGADKEVKDNAGRTVLMHAVQNNNQPLVKYFITEGSDIETTDLIETTPVILAAKEKYTPILKELVAAGADFNAQDKLGRSPLIWSLENKDDVTLFELLSLRGIQVNTPYGPNAVLPLMMAADNKDTAAVTALLETGAQLEAKDAAGETVLFHSVRANDLETATFLISNKAEIYFTNKKGQDMIDVARDARFSRMAILLATAPMDISIPQVGVELRTRVYDIEGYIDSLQKLTDDAKEVKEKRDLLKKDGILK